MPPQRKVSALVAKYGDKFLQAAAVHRDDEADYGNFGDLPPGIEGGVAQIYECKFDKYKKGKNIGEYYFIASATVIEPIEFAGTHIKGLQTRIMEAACDTPEAKGDRKTMSDHIGWIQNQLRIILKDAVAANPSLLDGDNLESTADLVKQAQPLIRFRTWKGDATPEFPNPRTTHQWSGVVGDDYVPPPEGGGVVDNSGPMQPAPRPISAYSPIATRASPAVAGNGSIREKTFGPADVGKMPAATARPAPSRPAPAQVRPATPPRGPASVTQRTPQMPAQTASPAVQPRPAPRTPSQLTRPAVTQPRQAPTPVQAPVQQEFNEFSDLDSLVARAEAGDEDARRELGELAEANGVSKEAIATADDWSVVAAMISGGEQPAAGEDGGEEADAASTADVAEWQEVAEVVGYYPLDARTRQPSKDLFEAQVRSRDLGKRTCDIECNGKLVKGVPWDKLVELEAASE